MRHRSFHQTANGLLIVNDPKIPVVVMSIAKFVILLRTEEVKLLLTTLMPVEKIRAGHRIMPISYMKKLQMMLPVVRVERNISRFAGLEPI